MRIRVSLPPTGEPRPIYQLFAGSGMDIQTTWTRAD
jgi:hypothetical protein